LFDFADDLQGNPMPISVSCPGCGKEYNVKDDAAGKKFKCKECEAIVDVPAGGDAASDPFGDPVGQPAGEQEDPFGNLDFGAPPPPAARPQRRSSAISTDNRSAALERLSGPAVGMMVTAGIGLLFTCGIGALMVFALAAAPAGQQQADAFVGIAINGVGLLFGTVMAILVMYGAYKMKNGESYGMAMAASIIAAIPCLAPCICMPFGIWGIVVLNDADVKEAFQ
jgi:ribosomal protein S27E